MILGIVFTLVILFFFPIILKKAKIPWYKFYTANNIFAKVSQITWWFINLWKDAITTYQHGGSIGEGGILIPDSSADNTSDDENNDIPPVWDDYSDLEL